MLRNKFLRSENSGSQWMWALVDGQHRVVTDFRRNRCGVGQPPDDQLHLGLDAEQT